MDWPRLASHPYRHRCLVVVPQDPRSSPWRCAMNSWLLIRRLRGPAFLILFGVTALLNQWGVLTFSRSWPLYLILAGLIGLAERAVIMAAPPVFPSPYASPYPQAAQAPPHTNVPPYTNVPGSADDAGPNRRP